MEKIAIGFNILGLIVALVGCCVSPLLARIVICLFGVALSTFRIN